MTIPANAETVQPVSSGMRPLRPALRTPDGRITATQAEELWALMKRTRTGEGRFLAAMCPNLRSVTQAPAADFPRLRNALLMKVNSKKRGRVMRDGFRQIIGGSTLIHSLNELTDRFEWVAGWTKANGPLEPDERVTIEMMMKALIARRMQDLIRALGIEAAFGLPRDDGGEAA